MSNEKREKNVIFIEKNVHCKCCIINSYCNELNFQHFSFVFVHISHLLCQCLWMFPSSACFSPFFPHSIKKVSTYWYHCLNICSTRQMTIKTKIPRGESTLGVLSQVGILKKYILQWRWNVMNKNKINLSAHLVEFRMRFVCVCFITKGTLAMTTELWHSLHEVIILFPSSSNIFDLLHFIIWIPIESNEHKHQMNKKRKRKQRHLIRDEKLWKTKITNRAQKGCFPIVGYIVTFSLNGKKLGIGDHMKKNKKLKDKKRLFFITETNNFFAFFSLLI